MQNRYRKMIVLASVLVTVGAKTSWGGPPNPTASDVNGNTAGGTAALVNTVTGPSGGVNNTAFGVQALSSNTTGSANTAIGADALSFNITGNNNTANGVAALNSNTTGNNNTASGYQTLFTNSTGNNNTATGVAALNANSTGNYNTATGAAALIANSTGNYNTATGAAALSTNSTGNNNTASGSSALASNTEGTNNTATGAFALYSNSSGTANTASGFSALSSNSSGFANTANGANALASNATGGNNVAIGANALFANSTGVNNIALGNQAGYKLTTGSGNIAIGHEGVAAEANTIRIGTAQARTFLAGVHGKVITGGSPVVINSSGQLGTVMSSARYKQDIHDMGAQSAKLQQLRPVTFRYTADPRGSTQYGLIAEEVAKVYPDIVVYGEKGEIEAVQYHQLISLLLNEVQQQQRRMDVRSHQLTRQSQEFAEIEARNTRARAAIMQVEALTTRLARLEAAQATRLAQR